MKIFRIIIVVVITLFFSSAILVLADQPNSQAERTQLEQQLADIEAQITQYQSQLATVKKQANTLANKVYQLKTQQASLQLEITATNLQLAFIESQIGEIKINILKQTTQLVSLRKEISDLIFVLWRQEQYPVWYYLLSSNNFNDIFSTLNDYYQVVDGLNNKLGRAKQIKSQLEIQQNNLLDQQEQVGSLLGLKVLAQNQLNDSIGYQNALLVETKGKESNYQKTVASAQQQAAAIKNRIYQLLDVSTQITFEQALQIANWAANQTGVRAAFLLAVLSQESNLGKNVGTCNRQGDPPEKSWRAVMKPSRDQEPFLQITKELGMDPDVTPVSCPMFRDGQQIGWGGAMGPAQFIPSTWMGYKDKVKAITGKTANPWDIRDAFLAAAIKLKAGGADGGRQGEWNAAMRYFSGSTNPAYSFYGDSVLAKADSYQDDIDQINTN